MLAGEGPLPNPSVPFISTSTSRATTSPPIRPTSTALFRSATRRRESTSDDPRGLAGTRRLNWGYATRTATCVNGNPQRRAGTRGARAVAGAAAAATARQGSTTGSSRRTGTTTSASDLPEFPSGSQAGQRERTAAEPGAETAEPERKAGG